MSLSVTQETPMTVKDLIHALKQFPETHLVLASIEDGKVNFGVNKLEEWGPVVFISGEFKNIKKGGEM